MIDSIKYRFLRPLIINPPYSPISRKLASNFLNINDNYSKINLDEILEKKILNLRSDGYFFSDVNSIGLYDNYKKLLKEVKNLGFPENGKILDIGKNDLLDFLKKKINEKKNKNYKINITELFTNSYVNEISHSNVLKKISSNYLEVNTKNTFAEIFFDHNLMNLNEPVETQMYHRDHNGILFLKVFIYLCDVDIENGPYSYIKESHKKKFMKNYKLQKNKIRNNIRYDNASVINQLKNNEKIFKGKSGSVIFSDTTGLHRGYTPNKNNFRLLLSMTFEPKNSFLTFSEIK